MFNVVTQLLNLIITLNNCFNSWGESLNVYNLAKSGIRFDLFVHSKNFCVFWSKELLVRINHLPPIVLNI